MRTEQSHEQKDKARKRNQYFLLSGELFPKEKYGADLRTYEKGNEIATSNAHNSHFPSITQTLSLGAWGTQRYSTKRTSYFTFLPFLNFIVQSFADSVSAFRAGQ